MSKHKFSRDANLSGVRVKAPPPANRAAILAQHGVTKMFKTCTAGNCNILGALHDQYRLAQDEHRFSDASALWSRISHHESGAECVKVKVAG